MHLHHGDAIMRTLLVSALALGAWTSAAFAEPVALTDVQMDSLTAGQITQSNTATITVTQNNSANEATVAGGSIEQSGNVSVTVEQTNSADGATVAGGGGG
jgi:hypothetical protein